MGFLSHCRGIHFLKIDLTTSFDDNAQAPLTAQRWQIWWKNGA